MRRFSKGREREPGIDLLVSRDRARGGNILRHARADATQAAGSAAPAVTLDAAEVNLLGDEVVDEDLNGAGRAGGAGTTGAEGTFTTPDALAALLNLGAPAALLQVAGGGVESEGLWN
jgi:hypothetical protein